MNIYTILNIGKDTMFIPNFNLTPEMAEKFLSTIEKQRPHAKHNSKKIAERIVDGKWKNNGQPFIFDENGHLVNGQHRSHACIIAGKDIQIDIRLGVPSDTFSTMDEGKKRSGSDTLASEGFNYSIEAAAGIKLIHRMYGKTGLDNQDILAFCEKHPEIIGYAQKVKGLYQAGNRVIPPGIGCGFYWWFASTNGETLAEMFFTQLYSGEGLSPGSPVAALTRQLIRSKTSVKENLTTDRRNALIVKAFNYFVQRRKVKNIRIQKGNVKLLNNDINL